MTDTIPTYTVAEGGTEVRLGRVERAILAALPRDGGFVSRDTVVRSAYPDHTARAAQARVNGAVVQPLSEGRALAEAAVSRAIGSLQRKGLVVRDRNRVTGRTLLRSPDAAEDPAWELVAQAEEDFSVHAAAMARHWRSLSRRARARAARLRVDRSPDGTESERRVDMALAPEGEAHAAAERLRDVRSHVPRAGDGVPASPAGPLTSWPSPGRQWWRSVRTRMRSGANPDSGGRA